MSADGDIESNTDSVIMVVRETKEIPLNKIKIGTAQFRTKYPGKGISELAKNIKKVGLINAITVCELENGTYELIAGQRRKMAVQKLGHDTIRANILLGTLTEEEKRTISLSENITIVPPSIVDYYDACTDLYRKYQSIEAVSLTLGLDRLTVSKFVNYDQLIPEIRPLVDQGIVTVKIAKRAQEAATVEGVINKEVAIAYAKEMRNMTPKAQRKMVRVSRKNPSAKPSEIIEHGRTRDTETDLRIIIASETNDGLEKFAKDSGTEVNDAASTLIIEGLEDKGYLEKRS